ncbi:MAG TPA: tetratricopeptide repeat protein [Labilithrix sp.]|nr:tetratricopeptide repeat protein [Labilithrix sp.]
MSRAVTSGWLLSIALTACAGSDKPVVVPAPVATTPAPEPPSAPPPVIAVAPPAKVAPPASAEPALPPPRPTTISLAHTGDEKLDAILAQGDKEFEAGDLVKAAASYKAAMIQAPKRSGPIVGSARVRAAKASPNLGFAASEKNSEVIAAARDMKRAADLEPTYGPAHVELGRAYLLLGDATNAEVALRKGARLLPDDAEAHSALGVALLALGKTEEALTELTRSRDIDPGSAARRGNLGTVLFMRGKVPEAIKEYEIEVRLVPDDPRAHSDLGTALLAQSDFARAIPELQRAIQLDPKRATFRSNLGYALQLSGKIGEAIAEYREALKLDPKLSSAWINLATALSRDPKTRGEARQALKTAAGLDPSDPRVKANLEELDALEKGTSPKP